MKHISWKRHIAPNVWYALLFLTAMLAAIYFFTKKNLEQVTPSADTIKNVSMTLDLGLMPAVDAAPILVAVKNGYFLDNNLELNIHMYINATERQSALQANQIDGAITDLVAIVTNNQNKFDIRATTMTSTSFLMVVKDGFDKTAKTQKAGLMEASVVNYIADTLSTYTLEKVYINEIPARIEMLKTGQIDLAILPEPVATNATLAGLAKMPISEKPLRTNAIAFTGKALSEKKEAIAAFHKAYNQGVEAILNDEQLARTLLVETLNLNEKAKDQMTLPTYEKAYLADEAVVKDVIEWVKKNLDPNTNIQYEQIIDRSFVK